MVRSLLIGLLFCACSGQAFAGIEVLRDSIFPPDELMLDPTAWTDGLPGGSTHHNGADWSTPGLVFDAANTGLLSEARFVIFAQDDSLDPENDLADIYTYHMQFHIWTDGVLGGTDSFDQNPRGQSVGGHIKVDANTPETSIIDVQTWGLTGPEASPSMFTTFLVTVDLSSAEIELQAGQQYVMSLLNKFNSFGTTTGGATDLGGGFRISGSQATGPNEDLFRDEESTMLPGYIDSQLGFGFEQYAGSLTISNGDYNGDNVIDAANYTVWRDTLGLSVAMPGDGADGNGSGIIDAGDYDIWKATFGITLTPPPAAGTVPEPSTLLLASLAGVLFCTRKR